MKTRVIALVLAAIMVLGGCSSVSAPEQERYEATFMTLFDTVTKIVGYAESEEAFQATAQEIHDELLEYHQLYDIYKDYDGINNIKTINDCAGGEPVAVDQKVIDLLLFCRELYEATDGRVNTAMGSVLSLWHDARNAGIDDPENSALPEADALNKAAEHTGFEAIVIDEKAGTIQITDPEVRLDVGAIAKGYAVQRIAEASPSGLLISVGGNVCATGPKPVDESPWVVGVESPDKGAEEYLHTLYVEKGSVVTSGDYQRYYMVDGVRYHHIIDPDTKYPAAYWRSVTFVCEDSGLADALSTALFTLNQSDGQALLDRYHAEAMWVDADGNQIYSPGFSNFIRT